MTGFEPVLLSSSYEPEELPSCTVPSEQVHQAQEEPIAQPAKTESHMITMTETIFEGSHSKAHIKEKMDQVLVAYQLEATEDNYNRAAAL
jgi:hypothetical protein